MNPGFLASKLDVTIKFIPGSAAVDEELLLDGLGTEVPGTVLALVCEDTLTTLVLEDSWLFPELETAEDASEETVEEPTPLDWPVFENDWPED